MESWYCSICGYVYRPAEGDRRAGVQPGREFEELPPSWACPVCEADADYFEPSTASEGGR